MEITYTEIALEDLRRVPKRFASQIVAKVSKLQHGLSGDIKRLRSSTAIIGCVAETIACYSTLKAATCSSIVCYTAKKHMTKTALKNFTTELARKRRAVTRLQEDLADMLDHLAVIEARAKSAIGKRLSTPEVKRALGI